MKMNLVLALVLTAGVARAADLEKGKAAYATKCASCHGKDGKGNASMSKVFKVDASALDLTKKDSLDKKDEDLAAVVAKGRGKMPSFAGKLPDDQVADVLAYARSLSAPKEEAKTEAPAGGATAADAASAPADFKLDKTAKMPPVTFSHANHVQKKTCADCHGGEKPLFAQKRGEAGLKMADMNKGESCGACHNGKTAFATKTSCMKCHKK